MPAQVPPSPSEAFCGSTIPTFTTRILVVLVCRQSLLPSNRNATETSPHWYYSATLPDRARLRGTTAEADSHRRSLGRRRWHARPVLTSPRPGQPVRTAER